MPNRDRDAWDKDYSARGPVWSGAVADLPALPESSRVLELGCGNGKTLAGMLNKGWRVTATDFSSRAIALSRRIPSSGSAAELILSDARISPFRPGSFDAVFALHVLGHLLADERVSAVREIERVLRPGGSLFFGEFSVNDFRFGKGTGAGPGTFVRGNGIRTHYFTADEVHDLFASFGVALLEERTWPMRIRGKDFTRSEITAVLVKTDA